MINWTYPVQVGIPKLAIAEGTEPADGFQLLRKGLRPAHLEGGKHERKGGKAKTQNTRAIQMGFSSGSPVKTGIKGGDINGKIELPGLVVKGFITREEIILAVLPGKGKRICHLPLARFPVYDKQGEFPVEDWKISAQRREGNCALKGGLSSGQGAEFVNVVDGYCYVKG